MVRMFDLAQFLSQMPSLHNPHHSSGLGTGTRHILCIAILEQRHSFNLYVYQ